MSVSEKHTTFNDVVTVFDSFERTITEEKLHDAPFGQPDAEDADDSCSGSEVPSTPDWTKPGAGFFLDNSLDASDDVDGARATEDAADGATDVRTKPTLETQTSNSSSNSGREETQKTNKEAEMMNIFSNFGAPPDVLAPTAVAANKSTATAAVDVVDGGSLPRQETMPPRRKTSATKMVDLKSLMKAMDEKES